MRSKAAATFGEWVRRRRGEIGLGLREFAMKARVNAGNLSKYERDKLPPPQDERVLRRIAMALQIKDGSEAYQEFIDLAAASSGRIPDDLLDDPALVGKLPLLFRTARKLTREQLIELARRLKNL